MKGQPVNILLVEDDPAHAEIVRRNLGTSRIANTLFHVPDGQDALDYLFNQGPYSDKQKYPKPGLILLDLRLPKIDGLEVLARIKADEKLATIPTVILTTSAAETDVAKAYKSHANSYLVKPVDFSKFVDLLDTFGFYWLIWNESPFTIE